MQTGDDSQQHTSLDTAFKTLLKVQSVLDIDFIDCWSEGSKCGALSEYVASQNH